MRLKTKLILFVFIFVTAFVVSPAVFADEEPAPPKGSVTNKGEGTVMVRAKTIDGTEHGLILGPGQTVTLPEHTTSVKLKGKIGGPDEYNIQVTHYSGMTDSLTAVNAEIDTTPGGHPSEWGVDHTAGIDDEPSAATPQTTTTPQTTDNLAVDEAQGIWGDAIRYGPLTSPRRYTTVENLEKLEEWYKAWPMHDDETGRPLTELEKAALIFGGYTPAEDMGPYMVPPPDARDIQESTGQIPPRTERRQED